MFYWININDLQNYKLLPDSTYELIKDSGNIKHIIEKPTCVIAKIIFTTHRMTIRDI